MFVGGNFVRLFLLVFLSPSSLTHLCFQRYLSPLGKTDDFFRSPGVDPKTSIPETGSGLKSRRVSSSVTRAIPAVELVIHCSCPWTNDHLFLITSWSLTATECKQQATLKQESDFLPEEVTSKYLCSDVLTKGDLTQSLTFPFLQEQGIRQGQANANSIVSPKLLGTSPCRKLGYMPCPKVFLGPWAKASILWRKLLKLSTDQSCGCLDSRTKKYFCTFATEQDQDNALWQLLSLQEIPGKRPLTTVSYLAVVYLCIMHKTSKTFVWAVCYVISRSEESVQNFSQI